MHHSGIQFKRNLVQGVGSSGASLALTLITTPLMTRLYDSDAYGINGGMLTAATLISALGLLGLPVALAREHETSKQQELLDSSAQLSVVLLIATTLAVVAAALFYPGLDEKLVYPLLFLPVLVSAHCAQRIVDSLVTARGAFPALAKASIANAAVARVFTLGVGWLTVPAALVMLVGDSFGKLAHLFTSTRHRTAKIDLRIIDWLPRWGFLRRVIRDHREFATFSNIATVLPLAAALGIQVLIGSRLGIPATGQWVLAQSIATLPVSLVAMATAPIVFHRLVQVADATPAQLPHVAIKALGIYLLIGALCMAPLILAGPTLFSFVFGSPWRPAGQVAALIAVPQILAFGLTGLLSLFRVARKIQAWFWFELGGSVLLLAGVHLSNAQSLQDLAFWLAVLLTMYQVLMLSGCFYAAYLVRHATPQSHGE